MKEHRLVLLLILVISASIWIITVNVNLTRSRVKNGQAPDIAKILAAESYILKNLSAEQISERYSPVLLYRFIGGQWLFTGSGIFLSNSFNGRQVLTTEHLFSVDETDSLIGA